jgi:hypothetical protein
MQPWSSESVASQTGMARLRTRGQVGEPIARFAVSGRDCLTKAQRLTGCRLFGMERQTTRLTAGSLI